MDEVTLDECDALIEENWESFKRTNNLTIYEIIDDWLEYRFKLQMREVVTAKAA